MDLTQKKCEPCEGGTKPMTEEEIKPYVESVSSEWKISSDKKNIKREFVRENFVRALEFINQVGEIAESEGHHPDIHLTSYKHVTIELSTHAIGGLSVNDFILAAKVDQID